MHLDILLKNGYIKKIGSAFFATLASSLVIEVVQYFIGRSFDVDDIILNVVGGVLGYFVYIALNAIKNHLPKFLQKDFIYNIICLIIFIVIVLYLYNLNGGIKL